MLWNKSMSSCIDCPLVLLGEVDTVEGGERVWEDEYGKNNWVHMYIKRKVVSVETISGMRGEGG
jgi:hypothetical protein